MNPVVARVMAVLATLGMVLGAIAIRDRLDGARGDDQVITGPTPTPGTDVGPPDGEAFDVVCAASLRTACEELVRTSTRPVAIRYEVAATTADRLVAADDADIDAWIVLDPWPAIVDEGRDRGGRAPLFASTTTLARSPVVMVVATERLPVLRDACGGDVDWSCVGDVAGAPWAAVGGPTAWGEPKPGHAAPDDAVGSLVLAQLASSRIGTTTFSTRDLSDDGFRGWFSSLERAVGSFDPSGGTHLRQLLQFGPGTVDVLGTLEAEPAELLPRVGARADAASVIHPQPQLVAALVVAELTDGVAGALDASGLAAAGWRLGDAPPPGLPDAPPLPVPPVDLPSPGAFVALREVWGETVR